MKIPDRMAKASEEEEHAERRCLRSRRWPGLRIRGGEGRRSPMAQGRSTTPHRNLFSSTCRAVSHSPARRPDQLSG